VNALPQSVVADRPVLEVDDLSLRFTAGRTPLHALDRVGFAVARGEVLGLVGESGCGKSVTALAIMGLLPRDGVEIVSGSIRLGGQELLGAGEGALRRVRGNRIGMVFQDPMTSLNPVHTVGMQIAEVVRQHRGASWRAAEARALEMLDRVRIPDAKSRLSAYPHELSGGMRQRVMIAIALACEPELLIADEPTTALDVTVQAQILDLLMDLRSDLGMSIVLITHDLGVVASTADRMAVMYAGRVVEQGPVASVFAGPAHGYTLGLLRSLPGPHRRRREDLAEIPGVVPRLERPSPACTYAPRCDFATDRCGAVVPPRVDVGQAHWTRCLHACEVGAAAGHEHIVRAWR
jgi:peptide/nickel transport system ATP-binding protein